MYSYQYLEILKNFEVGNNRGIVLSMKIINSMILNRIQLVIDYLLCKYKNDIEEEDRL